VEDPYSSGLLGWSPYCAGSKHSVEWICRLRPNHFGGAGGAEEEVQDPDSPLSPGIASSASSDLTQDDDLAHFQVHTNLRNQGNAPCPISMPPSLATFHVRVLSDQYDGRPQGHGAIPNKFGVPGGTGSDPSHRALSIVQRGLSQTHSCGAVKYCCRLLKAQVFSRCTPYILLIQHCFTVRLVLPTGQTERPHVFLFQGGPHIRGEGRRLGGVGHRRRGLHCSRAAPAAGPQLGRPLHQRPHHRHPALPGACRLLLLGLICCEAAPIKLGCMAI